MKVINPFEGMEFPEDLPAVHVYPSAVPGIYWVDSKDGPGSMTIVGTVITFTRASNQQH